ncbi:hypothetical protein FS815_21460 [Agrobacterium vitis]|uniref:hypothetical protein n=1 Tax=Allorhizobium ampelinum TaxID=3025782 RepID=UPI001F1BBADF|nr:hypothetical protein [Allorhizobium ampelinum]MCF1449359.1 hypothetical protein [Allorhizobium ampelinum]
MVGLALKGFEPARPISFGLGNCILSEKTILRGSGALNPRFRFQGGVKSFRGADFVVWSRMQVTFANSDIFCEQFDREVLARNGRRTQRLETIVHDLGLALGGRPAAAFADCLTMLL